MGSQEILTVARFHIVEDWVRVCGVLVFINTRPTRQEKGHQVFQNPQIWCLSGCQRYSHSKAQKFKRKWHPRQSILLCQSKFFCKILNGCFFFNTRLINTKLECCNAQYALSYFVGLYVDTRGRGGGGHCNGLESCPGVSGNTPSCLMVHIKHTSPTRKSW